MVFVDLLMISFLVISQTEHNLLKLTVKILPRNKLCVEFLKGQFWGPCYSCFMSMIFTKHVKVVSFRLQMTQPYIYQTTT